MAERIVSPGVFTRERDVSFLPQGVSEIGAAVIGPTVKGPAFVPTTLTSFSEFENTFGGVDTRFYVPYTVKEYFDNGAPAVTIVRVLGIGGYQTESLYISVSSSTHNGVGAVLKPSRNSPTLDIDGPTSASLNAASKTWETFSFTVAGTAYTASFNTGSDSYITKVFSTDPQDTNKDLYVYKNFETFQSAKGFTSTNSTASLASGSGEDFTHDYAVGTTPYIISQEIGGSRKNLFKVNTRSHGTAINE